MPDLSPQNTLKHIQDRLGQGGKPTQIITDLLPQNRSDALTWGQRLSGWDEYRTQFSGQIIAIARVISKRAMRLHGLAFDDEGRVVESRSLVERNTWIKKPSRCFPLQIGEDCVTVEYTPGYFAKAGTDRFCYIGDPLPADARRISMLHEHKAHALSDTGWHSHVASHDAVEAAGGPEAYAAQYAEAVLQETDYEFERAFNGPKLGADPRPWRQRLPANIPDDEASPADRTVLGENTAQLAEDRTEQQHPELPPRQRLLFD
jgi:hypothetical protein